MRSEKFLVIAGLIVISIIWGSTWLAIKIGLESIPPFFGVALRFTLALGIIYLIMRLRSERLPLDRQSVRLYLTLAGLSFSFPFALVYWGEQYIPSGLASILFAVYPFVVAIGSHFYLPSEPLNPYKIAGIALSFTGVLVIFWADLNPGAANTLGMGAILLSTVLQGTALVLIKKKGTHISPLSLNCGGMLFGLAVMYALAFAFEDPATLRFDAAGVGSIVYLGTFGTVITFVIYYWLLKKIEAVYLSLVSLVTPVLAVILGTWWLGETLSPRTFTGAGLVILGIVVSNGRDVLRSALQARR